MSDDETFLARWSRLKREQAATHARDEGNQPSPVGLPPPVSLPPAVGEPPAAVSLASLPPIESIGPDTDITAYLGAGVPWELTQAALRSAWRTDPAVREFVEIADNQWDFNTPEAIPGFGPLGAAEEAKALVARAVTTAESTTATLASLTPDSERPEGRVLAGPSPDDSRVVDPVWQVGTMSVANHEPPRIESLERHVEPGAGVGAGASAGAGAGADAGAPAPGRRLHGSALPK